MNTATAIVETDAPTSFDFATARDVVTIASRAPSVHNTQPWSWEFGSAGLSLRADRTRQLAIADPDGHSLMVSCGAALELTGVALRGLGWAYTVTRTPDHGDPDLLAIFSDLSFTPAGDVDLNRVDAALRRQSDRLPFADRTLSENTLEALRLAADGDGVHLHVPQRAEELVDLAVAVSAADRSEHDDAALQAEAATWLRGEIGAPDGIPLAAVPKVTDGHPRHTDVPLRDFEIGVAGRELVPVDKDEHSLIAVLLADSDSPLIQLHAGEAMMRLMIAAELLGVSSCPLSQAVDLIAFRAGVQTVMGWRGYPQMMLRLGVPAQRDLAVRTGRRPVDQVLRHQN